jgi:hypothetical protein
MNVKRKLLSLLYALLLVGMCYSGLQLLGEKTVQAEAGICCSFSSDCPGKMICYQPSGGETACCNTQVPGCTGANYCRDQLPE